MNPQIDSSVAAKLRLSLLHAWWLKQDRAPIYRESVRKSFKEIFGNEVKRSKALEVFDNAVRDKHLVQIADAKNPRGVGYTFRPEFGKEEGQ